MLARPSNIEFCNTTAVSELRQRTETRMPTCEINQGLLALEPCAAPTDRGCSRCQRAVCAAHCQTLADGLLVCFECLEPHDLELPGEGEPPATSAEQAPPEATAAPKTPACPDLATYFDAYDRQGVAARDQGTTAVSDAEGEAAGHGDIFDS